MKKFFLQFVLLSALIILAGSGALLASSSEPQAKSHGIGPVKSVELGPLNTKWVAEGKGIFNTMCVVCHDPDQKKIGPALRNVTKQRAPEFIMNLLLNTSQMQKEDPTTMALLKEYNNIPMTDPGLTQPKARSVLEYLRSLVK
jgi:cytochrome c